MSVGRGFVVVTPSDTDKIAKDASGNYPDALFVGNGGTVVVVGIDGSKATLNNVANGQILPFACARINATGTTASGIVGIYI